MTNQDKRMLSNVSKMPGHSISRSARLCHVGQKLRKIKGSTCEKCYALKGMYNMPNVKQAMERREVFFHSIDFVPRMVSVLKPLRKPEFRWFDSGDVDSVAMGHNILDVCEATPHLVHWIPSREYKIWGDVLRTRNLASQCHASHVRPYDRRCTSQGMAEHKYRCQSWRKYYRTTYVLRH